MPAEATPEGHDAVTGGAVEDLEPWMVPPPSTPPPPGFEGVTPPSTPPPSSPASHGYLYGNGAVGVSPSAGEALRGEGGAWSAPPPPGFDPKHGDPDRLASTFIWADDEALEGDAISDSGINTRTSFSNLAAVLGADLAESMEATTREVKSDADAHRHQSRLLPDTLFDPFRDLSYARQSRHTASRLIGTSPPRDDSVVGTNVPAPASLYSGGGPPKHSTAGPPKSEPSAVYGRAPAAPPAFHKPGPNHSKATIPTFEPAAGRNRETTQPLSMFPGNISKSRLPMSKDLGITVMEPAESPAAGGKPQAGWRPEEATSELERGMQNIWLGNEEARRQHGFVEQPQAKPSSDRALDSEAELRPYLWDVHHEEPSRTLAILGAPSLHVPDLRSACEAFGVLEIFRPDFADRGVFFVSYYDIRSAQYAAVELRPYLKRLVKTDSDSISVYYCVPLNSSSQTDDSLLLLSDVPREVDEEHLASMLSYYGSVRSISRQGGHFGGSSYVIEFHNTQEARQALLELDSTQPLGADVTVEVGTRSPAERKKGREVLALIGRWRREQSSQCKPADAGRVPGRMPGEPPSRAPGSSESDPYNRHSTPRHEVQQTTQLVLGPDGRYSYVVVNHSPFQPPYGHPPMHSSDPRQPPHVVQHGPHGTTYISPAPAPPSHHQHGPPPHQHAPHSHQHVYWSHQPPPTTHQHSYASTATVVTSSPYVDSHMPHFSHGGSQSVPFYTHVITTPLEGSSGSRHVGVPQPSNANSDDKDNRHLMLDLDAVEANRDTRTSLMVRNIPNKYTQQMLLSEFTENGHGPGTIDFFYLPIDFKNRCNRGYAFINFVDHRDILTFHRQYFGKHWRTFNSDKICDITYARIQGKSAMLKRFENSALMEKDDEYKPLVFSSHGPDKGSRIPFPSDAK